MAKVDIQISNQGRVVFFRVKAAKGGWMELTMDPDLADDVSENLKSAARVARRNS